MSALPAIFFADLDATTIYSKRHLSADPDRYTGMTCVETFREEPQSFMTYRAVRQLGALSRELTFVPTTTRDVTQFNRIRLPGVKTTYAIVANGGRILVDGIEDPAWTRVVQERLAAVAPLNTILEEITRKLQHETWVKTISRPADLFACVNAHAETPAWFVEWADSRAARWRCRISSQGRKTFIVPFGISKESAAAEVVRRTGADVTFASGDSTLDEGLMKFADYAIHPRHGALNVRAPYFDETVRSGITAGEEILTYVSSRLERIVKDRPRAV
ncbi:HAD family hydrolase [Cryobacterium psychrophilum]|uniref:HAD family hydrolase n=1 Tax=Cryobacterium psychrophilum TaxID=41988 RepID=A0A4Y8KMI8_9MICO|nr:HAD family hydrolase [Cryobacterium psychrophilum]TDW31287.1 hypothetical protein EDD25_3092 [Cryobacterium psychrophilum]TFD78425.1 HAD family hydrolase [Cryobacterium psychrophilum]